MSILIRQAKIIDKGSVFHNRVVDIFIADGFIKDISTSLNLKADQTIETEGIHVSTGWVDVFADYREPGFEQKENLTSGLAAAAAGGFTKVFLVPNTHPVISNKSGVEYIRKKTEGNIVSAFPIGALTQNAEGKSLAEMLDMHHHGAIAFSDGWKPVQNAGLMLKALEYVRSFDGVVLQIPLDEALAAGGLMHEGEHSTRLGMPGIPGLAETVILHRDLELLRYTKSKLHFAGVSTAEGVEMIRKAKAEGLSITCSVTPYHLALTDEALNGYDSIYKVSPVLRSENDRKALITALKDGTIDCIASHHRPQEWDAKAKEFEYASDGMNLQEITFNVAWSAVKGEIGIERMVEVLTTAPRKIFNLDTTGIKKNNPAEITIFTASGNHELNETNIRSASGNNPFIGKKLPGKVLGIVSKNQIHLNK